MDVAVEQAIVEIMDAGQDLTLATIRSDGWPQATTVSYANDGMAIYFGIDKTSQKARNIEGCNKVSVTIDLPYETWDDIKGLSMAATASFVSDPEELGRAARLMTDKFPQIADMPVPDPGAFVFVKLTPKVVSVLDYTKGFGHTNQVEVL